MLGTRFTARSLSSLSAAERERFLKSLSEAEARELLYQWEFWARDNQLPPAGSWLTWYLQAGRGFGKTRTAAEWVRARIEGGRSRRFGFIGRTAADVRDTMVEGESGILACCPPWFKPVYQPSRRRVIWPSGAVAMLYSAEEPDLLRGPQHDGLWHDEIATWQYASETWSNSQMGLRIGDPQQVISTTPKGGVALLKQIKALPSTVVTRGSSYDNRENLARAFYESAIAPFEGTRLGRQELMAEDLEDNPDALWKREEMIEAHRVRKVPELERIAVGVDPPATSSGTCGIVVAGLGLDDHGYVLEDASCQGSPLDWATAVDTAYGKWQADRVYVEVNHGGEMVETTLRTVNKRISLEPVRATRGKWVRAEPVSSLYERGEVHHVGAFPLLEDEQCQWVPGEPSPNHLDALVWVMTGLMLKRRKVIQVL